MKRYNVRFNITMTYDVEVDACSKAEAEDLAEELFEDVDSSEFEFDDYEVMEPEVVMEYREPSYGWRYSGWRVF